MVSHYMKMALDLAAKAGGRTSPNPMVGAVLVKDGVVVGSGYHKKAGRPHAEIEALKKAGAKAAGADLYVNLEPCSFFGRTPPCCDALIRAGIRRIFVGVRDPNPRVSGKGLAALRRAGIKTRSGILREQCERLNEIFFKFITTGGPFVILKSAASLDGKIAASSGDSRWITGRCARGRVHELRDRVDAILVGVNTVIRDDPRLTARPRGGKGRNPVRVILDSTLKIPETARVLRIDRGTRTILATTSRAPRKKAEQLEARGVRVIRPGEKNGRVDMTALMAVLGEMEIASLLIEGGSEVNACALASGCVDKVVLFYAPKIIGGADAPSIFGSRGARDLTEAVGIHHLDVSRAGDDIVVTGYVHGNH